MDQKYGLGDNHTGDTTYNLYDGAQSTIDQTKAVRGDLDLDGTDESRAELSQAWKDGFAANGMSGAIQSGMQEFNDQQATGRFDGGEVGVGRAYTTIVDRTREVDPATGEVTAGNGGTDTMSYAGSEQSAFINLNDATLGVEYAPTHAAAPAAGGRTLDAGWADLSREIKGSDEFAHFNAELKDEIDASSKNGTLRPDGHHAGGFVSKLVTRDAGGDITDTQDGGYSIANGVRIENGSGGRADDILIGNELDNRLDGHEGRDTLYGGHGNDTLLGGEGNDTLVAGRGFNTLDGGADYDTASYRNLYDVSAGPSASPAGGAVFSISDANTMVIKPVPGIAGPLGVAVGGVDIDNLANMERFEGTLRADDFKVSSLDRDMSLVMDGRDELTVDNSEGLFTLDMTAGTYPSGHARAGEAYEATVTDGTHTLYLEGADAARIALSTPNPAPAPAPMPSNGADAGAPTPDATSNREVVPAAETLSLRDAAVMLQEDVGKIMDAQHARTDPLTERDSAMAELIESGMAVRALETLHDDGADSLQACIPDDPTPMDRATAVLGAAREALIARGLDMPSPEHDLTADSMPAYPVADEYEMDVAL